MGSSTGNMLVDKKNELEKIFAEATRLEMPVAVHCEDSSIIAQNSKRIQQEVGENPGVEYHPVIRSAEACYQSTKSAIELARKFGTQLNVMHISTERELELLNSLPLKDKRITFVASLTHDFSLSLPPRYSFLSFSSSLLKLSDLTNVKYTQTYNESSYSYFLASWYFSIFCKSFFSSVLFMSLFLSSFSFFD